MTNHLTREQVRHVDHVAMTKLGVPGLVLMENAGRNAVDAIETFAQQRLQKAIGDLRVAVLCGGGNNGGDGYVIVRQLHLRGAACRAWRCHDPNKCRGDAAVNHRITQNLGLTRDLFRAHEIEQADQSGFDSADIIVDALLGTGFEGSLRQPMATIVAAANRARQGGAKLIAIDVPSGLDCNTGSAAGEAITADATVTFVAPKIGFENREAKHFLGKVVVADIGVPAAGLIAAADI